MLPNCNAARVTSTRSKGAFGDRKVSQVAATPSTPFLPALVLEGENGLWRVNLDPALWPLKEGDVVATDTKGRFVIKTASLKSNPVDSILDHIRGEAAQVTTAGVEPGGSEFVGVQ